MPIILIPPLRFAPLRFVPQHSGVLLAEAERPLPVQFVADSPLEGGGFEPSVPR
jgi:hypothetical protein